MSPSFQEVHGAGYDSVRRTETRPPPTYKGVGVRVIEVFKRASDDTYWWTMTGSEEVFQVAPVTVRGVLTYHQVRG